MYHPRVLLDDLRHLLVACGLHKFIVIGTSMGGLLATGIGAVAPSTLRGVILNDIGPEIGDSGIGDLDYIGRDHHKRLGRGHYSLEDDVTGPQSANGRGMASRCRPFREGSDGRLHVDWDSKIVEPMRTLTQELRVVETL